MHAPGPPHYDPYQSGQHGGGRSHGRGGFHNSNRGRPHTGGDKMRHNNHKKPNGVPSTPQGGHQKPDAPSAGKKKKRKTNTLGLTPGDESDDDFNEEAKLVELIGPDAPKYVCSFVFFSLLCFVADELAFVSSFQHIFLLGCVLTKTHSSQSHRYCCMDRRTQSQLPHAGAHQSPGCSCGNLKRRKGERRQRCRSLVT